MKCLLTHVMGRRRLTSEETDLLLRTAEELEDCIPDGMALPVSMTRERDAIIEEIYRRIDASEDIA